MKITLRKDQFIDKMNDFARNSSSYTGYSYEALGEMWEYYTDMGAGDIEYDPISFHCEMSEMTPQEIEKEYSQINDNDIFKEKTILEKLNEYTWAVELENGNILFSYNF